jgi:hypothetical protein
MASATQEQPVSVASAIAGRPDTGASTPEVDQALKSLPRLWKFNHGVIVVHLVSAIDIHAQVFPMLPHALQQDRLIDGEYLQVMLFDAGHAP